MISDAEFTQIAGEALAARGINVPAETTPAPASSSEALAQPAAAPTVDEQIAALEAPQTGGTDVPQMAEAFFDKAVSPAAYDFGKAPPSAEAMPLEQQATIRTFLASEQIPAGVGTYLASVWNKAAASPPTPEAIEQAESAVRADLARAHGAKAPGMIAAAQAEVSRMAKAAPWLPDALAQTGLGNDRRLIEFLFHRAEVRKG